MEVDIGVTTTMEKSFPAENYFLLKDGSGHFLTENENILTYHDQESAQWQKGQPGRRPTLVGSDMDYIVVRGHSNNT